MPATVSVDDLIALNPGIWLETNGWIKGVGGKKIRPTLNVLQRRMNALYVSRLLAGKPVRGIVVKPRKRGASTMVTCHHYTQLQNFPHEGFIIGDRAETSGIVFDMFKYYVETDDYVAKWGNPVLVNNNDEIKWANGAKVTQGTAQGKASARGRTPQFVHETEKSHWEDAEPTADAVLNAVPDEGFTVIWEESTPFGFDNLFARDWGKARWPTVGECPDGRAYWKQWGGVCPDQPANGRTDLDYVRCFAAWYEFDTPGARSFIRLTDDEKKHIQDTLDGESWYRGEADLLRQYGNDGPVGLRIGREVTVCDAWEQLAWRRSTIKNKCGSRLNSFNSEHPSDPKTCFVSSGRAVFDPDALDRVFARTEEARPDPGQIEIIERDEDRRAAITPSAENLATVHVWERPIVGCRYILTADLAEGEDQTKGADPDAHSALILRDEFVDQRSGNHVRKRLVARVAPGNRMPIVPFARICAGLSLYYGNCIHIPEMNNSGLAYITAIRLSFPWVSLWKRSEVDPITGKKIKEMDGWRTTDTAGYGGIRSQIITHLHDVLREDSMDIACTSVHSQLANFVNKDGRMEAGIGHDDDVMCVAGETMIRCRDGVKPISLLVVGDEVLTHLGRYRRVSKVMNRHADDVFRLKAEGKPDIIVTSEHPIFACAADRKYQPKTEGMIRDYLPPEFTRVSDLAENEFGSTSTPEHTEIDAAVFDILPFCPENYREIDGKLVSTTYGGTRINPKATKIGRWIPVDDDFCMFLGFYFAQGGCGKHTITLTFNVQHTGIEQWLTGYLQKLGFSPTFETIEGCRRVSFGSVPWTNFFKSQMKAWDRKRFPVWIESLPVAKQAKVLEGYFLGDGCFAGLGGARAVTISMTGGWQIWEMAMRCGMQTSLKMTPAKGRHKPQAKVSMGGPATGRLKSGIQSEVMEGKLNSDSSRNTDQTRMKFAHGYLVGMVTSITPEPSQTVWNIHVEEDESYTANGHIVHNCLAIGLFNIGHGTVYSAEIRERFVPPEIRRYLAKQGDETDLAMRF